VPSEWASSRHAEIRGESGSLTLVDLGSTNGTFLNGAPVTAERPLCAGDVVHVADFEFRVSREGRTTLRRWTTQLTHQQLPSSFEAKGKALRQLLAERAVAVDFEPIVDLRTGRVAAIEALGRGTLAPLPPEPSSLFEIAADLGLEADLSRAFRQETLHRLMAVDEHSLPPVLLNVHPIELSCPELTEMLVSLRRSAPKLELVVEIPKELLEQTSGLLEIRAVLDRLGVRMAYDDFGVGQARLAELAEAPPDFFKFDAAFTRRIDTAAPTKRRLLSALVAATRELGAIAIAAGIETAAERDVCREAGFDQAQGPFFGAPVPLAGLDASRAPQAPVSTRTA